MHESFWDNEYSGDPGTWSSARLRTWLVDVAQMNEDGLNALGGSKAEMVEAVRVCFARLCATTPSYNLRWEVDAASLPIWIPRTYKQDKEASTMARMMGRRTTGPLEKCFMR